MKKALLIFGLIALAGIIGFVMSVKAIGVKDSNYSVSIGGQKFFSPVSLASMGEGKIEFVDGSNRKEYDAGKDEDYTFEFSSGIPSDMIIESTSAHVTVMYDLVEYAQVRYHIGSDRNYSFKAAMSGDRLRITEEYLAPFGSFMGTSGEDNTITVLLPERSYGKVEISNISGSVEASGLECRELAIKLLSGSGEYSVYADDITAEMASGDLILKNCTGKNINKLDIKTLSGTVYVDGFAAKDTIFSSTSGKLDASGLGGSVTLKSTSGTADLGFAEWTGDLTIKKTSGTTNVKLPTGDNGIDLIVSCTSGGVSVTYNGDTDDYGDDEDDRIGGSNVHKVNVGITSGKVNIDIP